MVSVTFGRIGRWSRTLSLISPEQFTFMVLCRPGDTYLRSNPIALVMLLDGEIGYLGKTMTLGDIGPLRLDGDEIEWLE